MSVVVFAMKMLCYMAGILRRYGNVNYHHLSEPRDRDIFPCAYS